MAGPRVLHHFVLELGVTFRTINNTHVQLQLGDIDAYGTIVHLVHPRMQALDSCSRFMLSIHDRA